METVQQEVLSALLLMLQRKGLVRDDIYDEARYAILQKTDWPNWFDTSGT